MELGGTHRTALWDQWGSVVTQMVADNVPMTTIVEETGMSAAAVYKRIAKHGWEYKPRSKEYDSKSLRVRAAVLGAFDAKSGDSAFDLAAFLRLMAERTQVHEETVRRILKDHRVDVVAALAARTPSEKVCSGCQEQLPLSSFPLRADRVGKMHSMCVPCQVDYHRRIRHDNPTPIREASRRRRARIRGSRTDRHKEDDVLAQSSQCWFCHEPIDLALSYPHPRALSIHHIHPISKRGPDVLKNVAASHSECNREAKDHYIPPYRDWSVVQVPYPVARDAIIANHYLHRVGNISFAYGIYDGEQTLRGIVSFGSPSSQRIATSASSDPLRVIELNRLWIDDDAPFGIGSWFLSRALKSLPPFIVISYADTGVTDPRFGSRHDGAIYRAASFRYGGSSAPGFEWQVPGSTRHVLKDTPGAVQVPLTPKNRYWAVTGTKSEKRELTRLCKWQSLPYPSRALDSVAP